MYWRFSFSISPSNDYSGLISFRMDWLDLLAVQGTLKSLLQHHSFKASIFQCSAFFMVQLSHPYVTTGKIIALTRWTFVGKVMSLFFNMLSRLVIAFLPRSKRLLISWLQSPSAVILQPKKIQSVTISIVSPSVCHEVMYTLQSDGQIASIYYLSSHKANFQYLLTSQLSSMPYSITDYYVVHYVFMTYFMMASLYLLTSFTHFVHPTILLHSGLLYMVFIC